MNKADVTLLATIGVIILIVSAAIFVGIRPLWGKLTRLRGEQTKTAQELAELEKRLDTLAALSKKSAEVENLGERATSYLPTTVASGPFLMDVAAISGVSGTSVPTVSFQQADAKKAASGGVLEHPITMTVEGKFEQLKSFLGNTESNLRFSSFSSLTISTIQDILSLQLAGLIYSKSEAKETKDTSLEITPAMEDLLLGRKIFGAPVQIEGPNRGDPFSAP